jgi:membrane protease YdiL (CAAX protease family)
MAPWKAARTGDHFDEIDTPALLLDMDAFERNLGLLQNALARHLPVWAAILGAAAIFGAVHMDLHAFPALMAMGAVFGLLYHKTGSLRVTIIAHMANNGAALLLS